MPLQKMFQKKEFEEPMDYRQAYVEQLFKMAHSDGHMDECEYHFILKVAQRLEIEVDFEHMHQNLKNISLDALSSQKFGFDLLFDMSWLMLVDGEIDDRELELGINLGTQLGFQAPKVRQMVLSIVQHKKMGLPPSEIKDKLKQLFGPE
ncbi:MAG: hypothetical protein E2O88_03730 [Bacteroidetes bacterium]|nr:MAG: hypothetical protein E2O86_05620 [Bacteroidota bacterium]TDI70298.1 MAG: hypothetical protein E2O88_03730 [Bacteroidota bacterium]